MLKLNSPVGSQRRWLAVAVLAALAILAATGIAAAKLKTVSSSTTITSGAPTVTARCPNGSEAVSGGFANPDFDPSPATPQIFPFKSRRKGNRAWEAAGFNMESESGTFRVFAYCDPREPGLTTKPKETTLAPSEVGSATARCPQGSEAVAGGFANPDFANFVSPGADITASASKRVGDRSWKATGYNGGDAPGTLVAFAYCDKREPGLKAKSKGASITSNDVGSATARCPKGREAVSGGFNGHAVDTLMFGARGAFPFTSKRRSTRSWKVSAYGSSISDTSLTTFAYCK